MVRTLVGGVGVHGDHLGGLDHLEAVGVAELVGSPDEHHRARRAPRRPARTPRRSRRVPCRRPWRRRRWGGCSRARRGAQSTSMAWRPWYQPQLPHTTWGRFTAPQRGQVLRAVVRDRPGRGPAAAALGLGGLLLGDGHRRSSVWWGAVLGENGPRRRERARGRDGPGARAGESTRRRPENRSAARRAPPTGGRRGARRPSRLPSSTGSSPSTTAGKTSGAGPRQSSLQSGARGRVSSTASRTIGSRSTVSSASG